MKHMHNSVFKVKLASKANIKSYNNMVDIRFNFCMHKFYLWYDNWYISPIYVSTNGYKEKVLVTYVFNIRTKFVTKIEISYTEKNYEICNELNLHMDVIRREYRFEGIDRYEAV